MSYKSLKRNLPVDFECPDPKRVKIWSRMRKRCSINDNTYNYPNKRQKMCNTDEYVHDEIMSDNTYVCVYHNNDSNICSIYECGGVSKRIRTRLVCSYIF